VDFIFNLAEENAIPIFVAGDLGHRPQWPNWLLEKFINKMNQYSANIILCFGQHDIPQHNVELISTSAVGVLLESHYVISAEYWDEQYVAAFHYGERIKKSIPPKGEKVEMALAHQMVVENQPDDYPGQVADNAKSLLKRFPQYRLILCGDNHKPFVVEHEGRILVNPGSMMRSTADQTDHKPRVYLWDGEVVEPVYLPIEEGVISREHIDISKERDGRITAYVDRLKTNYEIGLDFKKNMVEHFKANRTRKEIEGRVWGAMEE